MKIRLSLVLLVGFLLPAGPSCGRRLPPPGGPEDTEPPVLEETDPEQMQTGVDLSAKISFFFDENVDERSVEKAFRLSPEHESLKISVHGNRVELRPEGGLFPGTTYQVTVTSLLADERNNKFQGPYTLTFATGDSLDSGVIRGKVTYRGKRAGGAYIVAETVPDSMRYHAQADSSGRYVLAHLPERRFLMQAFLDQNGDGKYRFAVEPEARQEVELSGEPVTVDFDLAVTDTSPPVLESVEAPDSVTIRLVFDEPLEIGASGFPPGNIAVRPEKEPERSIAVESAVPDTASAEVLVVTTAEPLADAVRYLVEVSGAVNEAGLVGRAADNRKLFTFYRP